MTVFSTLGAWDAALIAAVSLQTAAMAYLSEPRWKALVYTLPFPFTFAALALGRPIDATNVAGIFLLMIYVQVIRVLHVKLRWPITFAIIAAVFCYASLATQLVKVLPSTTPVFYVTALGAIFSGALLLRLMPQRSEPSHRTPLPLWFKLPIIVAVVCGLVLMKKHLGGFMTTFPMVGIVGAYEARHSLWTMGRQVPVMMLTVIPMMSSIYLAQRVLTLPAALVIGWLVFVTTLFIFTPSLRGGSRSSKDQLPEPVEAL